MTQANSDDMEKNHSEQPTNDPILEVEDDTGESADNQNGETVDTQKTILPNELVPFTPEVVDEAAQPLTSNTVEEQTSQNGSDALQWDHMKLDNLPPRVAVYSVPRMSSVRTSTISRRYRVRRRRKLVLRYLSRKHLRLGRIEGERASNRFWTRFLGTIAIVLIIFLIVAGGVAYAAYNFYLATQAQYNAQIVDLRNLMPGDNLKMYDRNGIFIGQDTEEGMKTEEPLAQISSLLQTATVDTEDKTFWTNAGIDVTRIIQSAIDDLRSNRVVEGGSTITQQLIKNLILTKDQNFQRKLEEISLVPDVNNHYSKADILEMYLNSNNYGETAYGPEAAAMVYFGLQDQGSKSAASQLDLAQAAMLAGIPNSPTANDPLKHPQEALIRMQVVLNAMLNNKDITQAQESAALQEALQPDFYKPSSVPVNRAPHFYYFILDQLKQQYNLTDQQLGMSDMKVYTTLDINLQDQIQKIAQDQIAALAGLNVTNAAEVLIDFHTGAIISMLGSIDYYNAAIDGKVNVALSYRQPGSSFKPYVYVTAFSDGISPGQGVADEPLHIQVSPTETYSPQDADGKFHGQMTIRCALQNSFNIPAVRTLQYVGIDNAMQTAQEMGITSYTGTPGYSLVLGGLGVRLLDHTSAYGTFADGGIHVPYYGVEKIVLASTNSVSYQHQLDPGTRAISPQLAYMMTNVLSDNVARTPEFGKCSMLYLFSNSQYNCYAGNPGTIRPAAVKTGTTNDFRDNLTMGYTTDYVMGVWAGNDDNSPMDTVLGVTGAAPIWHFGMLAAEQGHPVSDFTNPGDLQTATLAYPDGVHSTDLFLQGANPKAATTNAANQIFAPRGSGGTGTPWCTDFSY